MSGVELVQVIVSVDGAPYQVVIPPECKPLLLQMMQGFQNDRTLMLVRLPDTVGLIPLHDVIKSES